MEGYYAITSLTRNRPYRKGLFRLFNAVAGITLAGCGREKPGQRWPLAPRGPRDPAYTPIKSQAVAGVATQRNAGRQRVQFFRLPLWAGKWREGGGCWGAERNWSAPHAGLPARLGAYSWPSLDACLKARLASSTALLDTPIKSASACFISNLRAYESRFLSACGSTTCKWSL